MTKREAERQTHQQNMLLNLGFTHEECEQLRRISMTLHRWHEKECGTEYGGIERDKQTGKPFWTYQGTWDGMNGRETVRRWRPMADLEKGAMKRLRFLMSAHPQLATYIQTDPRGAALYIIRPGDVPEGANVDSYYSRGVCVY